MKLLTFRHRGMYTYAKDIDRLKTVARERGYIVSSNCATQVWREHSDTMAAGWLIMDSYTDDNLMDILLQYTNVDDVEG